MTPSALWDTHGCVTLRRNGSRARGWARVSATGDIEELRIHGVAGTPPAAMLGLDAVLVEPRPDGCGRMPTDVDADVEIYDPPSLPERLRAFSWSSLTSGSAKHALWVLLVPYMLANVAGWTLPRLEDDPPTLPPPGKCEARPVVPRGRRVRTATALVRLAGLCVTGIFVGFLLLAFADLFVFQRVARDGASGWTVVGIGLTGVAVGIVFAFTRVRPREPTAPERYWSDDIDPVGYAHVHTGQVEMWNRPGIIVRLRRLHLAWAWGLVALVTAILTTRDAGSDEIAGDEMALLAVAAAGCALPVALVLWTSLREARIGAQTWIRWIAPGLSLVALVWAGVELAVDRSFDGGCRVAALAGPCRLPVVRPAIALVGISLVALSLAATLVARRGSAPAGAQWNSLALLVLAGAVATIFGGGAALWASRFEGLFLPPATGVEIGSSVEWLAVAALWSATALGAVLATRLVAARCGVSRRDAPPWMVALSAVIERPTRITALVALVGTFAVVALAVAAVTGGYGTPNDLHGAVVAISVGVVVASPVLAALWWAWRLTGSRRVAAVVVIVAAVVGVTLWVGNGGTTRVLGVPVPPTTFVEFAFLLTLALPLAFVVSRVVWGGVRSREARRGPAVLWDVGAFWPRWFHPFAPPTYSDRAVTAMSQRLSDVSGSRRPVLVAPHSQGSIIAMVALAALDDAGGIALLTCGSPARKLYAEMFPDEFGNELFAAVSARLREGGGPLRWCNLYRVSDPIGGPVKQPTDDGAAGILEGVDVELNDRCGRWHSSYHLEPEYGRALDALRDALVSASASSGDDRATGRSPCAGSGETT